VKSLTQSQSGYLASRLVGSICNTAVNVCECGFIPEYLPVVVAHAHGERGAMDDIWRGTPLYLDTLSLLHMACADRSSAAMCRPVLNSKQHVLERLRAGWMKPIAQSDWRSRGCGIPPALWSDYDVVMFAVREDGCALQWASHDLRSNHNIALAAVQQDSEAWAYVYDIQHDQEIFYYSYQW